MAGKEWHPKLGAIEEAVQAARRAFWETLRRGLSGDLRVFGNPEDPGKNPWHGDPEASAWAWLMDYRPDELSRQLTRSVHAEAKDIRDRAPFVSPPYLVVNGWVTVPPPDGGPLPDLYVVPAYDSFGAASIADDSRRAGSEVAWVLGPYRDADPEGTPWWASR